MVNYQVTLRPVYSCPADEIPDGIKVPQGWRLSWHQVETWKALNDPDVDVIFNTAMTGDGKSLAAYLRTLQGYFPMFISVIFIIGLISALFPSADGPYRHIE